MSSPDQVWIHLAGLDCFDVAHQHEPKSSQSRRTSPFTQRQSNDAPQQHATPQGPTDTRLIDKLFEGLSVR